MEAKTYPIFIVQPDEPLEKIAPARTTPPADMIPTRDRMILAADIRWISEKDGYCVASLKDKSSAEVPYRLSALAGILPREDFVQIHCTCIVNLAYVDKLIGNCLCLGNDMQMIVQGYRHLLSGFIFFGIRDKNKTESSRT